MAETPPFPRERRHFGITLAVVSLLVGVPIGTVVAVSAASAAMAQPVGSRHYPVNLLGLFASAEFGFAGSIVIVVVALVVRFWASRLWPVQFWPQTIAAAVAA
jgi:hypothetical protein